MIRWFGVRGLEVDGVDLESFGFVDTVTDRVVEIGDRQLFCDYKDFLDAIEDEKWDEVRKNRFCRLIPTALRE